MNWKQWTGLALAALAGSLCLFLLVLQGFWSGAAPALPDASDKQARHDGPPNVIVILADDLGFGDLSAYGNKVFSTPNIDALAQNGVRFTNAYSAQAVCAPSRAGLLTSRYPQSFGFEFNAGEQTGDTGDRGVPGEIPTLAEGMRANGYVTGMIGKWHLGTIPGYRPMDRGFDHFFGMFQGISNYIASPGLRDRIDFGFWLINGGIFRWATPIWNDGQVTRVKEYLTDRFTIEARRFIRTQKDKPFFLYLAYNAPHGPAEAPHDYLKRVKDIKPKQVQTYAAMVTALDDGVGAIVEELKAQGIADNTVIIFTSDNGCPIRFNKGAIQHCSNGPLAYGKGTLFEGGVHVPFIVTGLKGAKPGSTFAGVTSLMDIMPTVENLAVAGSANGKNLDGVDLTPFLLADSNDNPHPELFWRAGPAAALREGDMKFLTAMAPLPDDHVERQESMWGQIWESLKKDTEKKRETLSPAYGLVAAPAYKEMLFNLGTDLGESMDLSQSDSATAAAMKGKLTQWASKLKEPSWPPQNVGDVTLKDGTRVRFAQ